MTVLTPEEQEIMLRHKLQGCIEKRKRLDTQTAAVLNTLLELRRKQYIESKKK